MRVRLNFRGGFLASAGLLALSLLVSTGCAGAVASRPPNVLTEGLRAEVYVVQTTYDFLNDVSAWDPLREADQSGGWISPESAETLLRWVSSHTYAVASTATIQLNSGQINMVCSADGTVRLELDVDAPTEDARMRVSCRGRRGDLSLRPCQAVIPDGGSFLWWLQLPERVDYLYVLLRIWSR